ncbi:MAG: glycosyltransferase [Candidatus Omnitrophota bacterium]
MKILFLTSRLPYPPYGGDKVRVYNFLKQLAVKHQVTLISFIEDKSELKHVAALKEICQRVEVIHLKKWQSYLNCLFNCLSVTPLQMYYYNDRRMRKLIKQILTQENIDGIYVHLLRMAHYVEDFKKMGVPESQRPRRKILDLTDAISLSLKRSLSYRSHVFFLFYLFEWWKVKRYEARIIDKFDASVLISMMDKQSHPALAASEKVRIIANGVDLDYFSPQEIDYHKQKIVFLGNFHSFPNRDGVNYLYHQIMPMIKEKIPGIKLYIVGVNPPKFIQDMADQKNIFVTGSVPDVREFLKDALALVCPLRVGAGIQNKILEAMALGLPVITTSIGAFWLSAEGQKKVMIGDEPHHFAQRILELMDDSGKRKVLSQQARDFVVKNYNWQNNVDKLESLYDVA